MSRGSCPACSTTYGRLCRKCGGRHCACTWNWPCSWPARSKLYLQLEPLCQVKTCGRKSAHVDHIVPRWAGGSDHPSNLQALCALHHGTKTYREKAGGFEYLADTPEKGLV